MHEFRAHKTLKFRTYKTKYPAKKPPGKPNWFYQAPVPDKKSLDTKNEKQHGRWSVRVGVTWNHAIIVCQLLKWPYLSHLGNKDFISSIKSACENYYHLQLKCVISNFSILLTFTTHTHTLIKTRPQTCHPIRCQLTYAKQFTGIELLFLEKAIVKIILEMQLKILSNKKAKFKPCNNKRQSNVDQILQKLY